MSIAAVHGFQIERCARAQARASTVFVLALHKHKRSLNNGLLKDLTKAPKNRRISKTKTIERAN